MRSLVTLKSLLLVFLLGAAYLVVLYLTLPEQRLSGWLQQHEELPFSWQALELEAGDIVLGKVSLTVRPDLVLDSVRIQPDWSALLTGRAEGELVAELLGGLLMLDLTTDADQYQLSGTATGVDLARVAPLIGEVFELPVEGVADLQFDLALSEQRQLTAGAVTVRVPAMALMGLPLKDGVAEAVWKQGRWGVKGKVLGDLLAEGSLQLTPQRAGLALAGKLDLRKGAENPLVAQLLPEGRALLKVSGSRGDYQIKCERSGRYCPKWAEMLK